MHKRFRTLFYVGGQWHNIRPCSSSTKHALHRSTSLYSLSLLFSSFISGASSSSSVLSRLFNAAERCCASNRLQNIRCYIAETTEWLRYWHRATNTDMWQRNLIFMWDIPAVFSAVTLTVVVHNSTSTSVQNVFHLCLRRFYLWQICRTYIT